MPRTKKQFPYETSDITFAAALLYLGHKLDSTQADGPYRVKFIFMDGGDDEIEDLHTEFVNGSLKVDPNELMSNIRNLKGMANNSPKGRVIP